MIRDTGCETVARRSYRVPSVPSVSNHLQELDLVRWIGQALVVSEKASVLTKAPQPKTDRHGAISHARFRDLVTGKLNERFEVLHTVSAITGSSPGETYYGVSAMRGVDPRYVPVFCYRQSHSGRVSSSIYLGVVMPEIDSAMISHVYPLGRTDRRYESTVDANMTSVLETATETFDNHLQVLHAIEAERLNERAAMYVITQLFRRRAFVPHLLPHVIEDWYAPPTPALAKLGNRAERLMATIARHYLNPSKGEPLGALIDQSPEQYAYWHRYFTTAEGL